MSEEKKNNKRKESRRESRNHIFNIIFQSEFHDLKELDEAIKNYYDVLEDEIQEEKEISIKFYAPEFDKEFVESELKGIVENINNIDEVINEHCIGWSVDRIAKVDLAILRLATYEILYREDIPNGVSVNEAVELAKEYSEPKSPAFINGVLASIVKGLEA